MSTYCDVAPGHEFHGPYHDSEYGFPLEEDAALLERFALEINQAGLSWLLMLKKREAFRKAFRNFDVDRVARFTARDEARLLGDPGIIRNQLKVRAVIENARRIRALRNSHGSFAAWIAAHHPRTKAEWVKLFRREFVFTGGEIVGEFLMSIGYLPGAHHVDCPVHRKLVKIGPPWMKARGFTY
ncbi:MAG TPA: DNA-3-methyladenine glycosylase I [Alphaproteobacteria bacterium]|nr:DNA-3-methyladenine glycosylase I [Alphaproteobacteria bacterium]